MTTRLRQFTSPPLLIGLLVVISCFSYANALPNSFVWDDEYTMAENRAIRGWDNLPRVLTALFTSETLVNKGTVFTGSSFLETSRPLASLSHFVLYQWFGDNPAGFRVIQIAFHSLNVALIYLIIYFLFRKEQLSHAAGAAFLVGLIFAIHPANVEAVQYISSLSAVTSTSFVLLALLLMMYGLERAYAEKPDWYVLLVVLLLLTGLLIKETALIGFLLIGLYLFLFRSNRSRPFPLFLASSALALVGYAYVRTQVNSQPFAYYIDSPINNASLLERLLTIPAEIWGYLVLIVFPAKLQIYQNFVIGSIRTVAFWGPLLGVIIVSVATYWLVKTQPQHGRRLLIFFLAWFVLNLLPILNLIPLGMTLAERWLYQGLVGAIAFLIILATLLYRRFRIDSYVVTWLLIVVVALLFVRTQVRIADWRSPLTLFGHDMTVDTDNGQIANNYAVALFNEQRYSEAEKYFRLAAEKGHDSAMTYNNLGVIEEKKGHYEAALEQYRLVAEQTPYYLAHRNLGNMLLKLGRHEAGKTALLRSVEIFPQDPELKVLLAAMYYQTGDKQKAAEWLRSALAVDPGNALARQFATMMQEGREIKFVNP